MVGVGPWEYRAVDVSGYARLSPNGVAALIRRAEEDFRASPAYSDGGPRPISVAGAARGPDGRILIAFSIGGVSDTRAMYIFNSEGEIVDRYLHSFWGY